MLVLRKNTLELCDAVLRFDELRADDVQLVAEHVGDLVGYGQW